MELNSIKKSANDSGIGAFFKLKQIKVAPDDILLDPRNPRLGVDSEEFDNVTEEEISGDQVQRAVLRNIEKRQHHIKDLMDSIGRRGFLPGLGSFIVKQSSRDGRYIVVEGNRRTAAIKELLRYPTELSSPVKHSLKEIEVSEFQFLENESFSEEQIVEMLLGIIHLQGPLPWGPMEKARYIYQAYKREYGELNRGKEFTYTNDVVRKLCSLFPLSQSEVKKSLRVYRVFRQLMEAYGDIDPDRYSLIEVASKNKVLREEYFFLNENTMHFSQVGLERFYTLCVDNGRAVNDPKAFNKFAKIVQHGDEAFLEGIFDATYSVEEMYDLMKDEIMQGELYGQLEAVYNRIQSLNVGALSEAGEDCLEMIERIIGVVHNRLGALVDYVPDDDPDYEAADSEMPDNIDDALDMPDVLLKKVIIDVMRERPKMTCVKDHLIKFVLKYMDIRTTSGPRRCFNKKLNDVIKEMVYEGTIQIYQAKNVRLRLMI